MDFSNTVHGLTHRSDPWFLGLLDGDTARQLVKYDLGYVYFEKEDLPYIRMFGLTCVFTDYASRCAFVGRSTVNHDPSKPMNAYFVTLASLTS
jgi:hypothetical protein